MDMEGEIEQAELWDIVFLALFSVTTHFGN